MNRTHGQGNTMPASRATGAHGRSHLPKYDTFGPLTRTHSVRPSHMSSNMLLGQNASLQNGAPRSARGFEPAPRGRIHALYTSYLNPIHTEINYTLSG